MKPLNKKDLEKVHGGYSGNEPDGYKSIENPKIGDRYYYLGLGELDIYQQMKVGPNVSYEYTSEGWMDTFTGQIVY